MKTIGVYTITNIVTGDVYVGSSRDTHHREISHFSQLKRGVHENHRIQKSFNKHGIENFIFFVVEDVGCIEKLSEREQFWMDKLNPQFNILSKADNHSINKTEELLKKYKRHGDMMRGRKMSEGEIEKLSRRMKKYWEDFRSSNKTRFTKEQRQRISDGSSPYLYTLISPDGQEVQTRSIYKFSKENGLSPNWMQHMVSGKRKSNAGWTLKEKVYLGYKKERQA